MRRTDDAEAMRLRAHQIWEREGRPQGREHEHWAEAARQLATESRVEQRPGVDDDVPTADDAEARRLRQALYAPEAFSVEIVEEEWAEPAAAPRQRVRRPRQKE